MLNLTHLTMTDNTGMDFFIPKPFNYADFEAEIRAHIRVLNAVPPTATAPDHSDV